MNPSPFDTLHFRSFIYWVLLSVFALLIPLAVESEGSPHVLILGAWVTFTLAAGMLWKCFRHGVKLKPLVGPLPRTKTTWALIILVIPLILFAFGSFALIYYPLSFVAPSFVGEALNSQPFHLLWETPRRNIAIIGLIVLIGPTVEEFFFRGVLLNRLTKKWGLLVAILTSSGLFGILHASILSASVFGLVMAVAYIKTRSLLIPIAIHMLNNAIAIGYETYWFATHGRYATVAEFRAGWEFDFACLLVSTPILVYFLYRNWPPSIKKLPYEQNVKRAEEHPSLASTCQPALSRS